MSRPQTAEAIEPLGPVACENCDLAHICSALANARTSREGSRPCSVLRSVRAGEHLYRSGDPASAFFAVRKGLIKLSHRGETAVTETATLKLPGETLGLEAFGGGSYADDAIALTPTICCELPISILDETQADREILDSAIIRLLASSLEIRPTQLTGKVADRVNWYLNDLRRRLESHGIPKSRLLPLSHEEIAALLDVHPKSAQRELQRLQSHSRIQLHHSGIRLDRKSPSTSTNDNSIEPNLDLAHSL